jgi:hypothetical protein
MDVSEVTAKLPWLTITSSSDSESDTNLDNGEQSEERKLRQKWGCIRQASLLTLKIIVKNTGKRHLCQYWTSFLPNCNKESFLLKIRGLENTFLNLNFQLKQSKT